MDVTGWMAASRRDSAPKVCDAAPKLKEINERKDLMKQLMSALSAKQFTLPQRLQRKMDEILSAVTPK